MRMRGKVTVKYGDDINTDYIIPAYLLQESWDNRFFADHAFVKYDPEFVKTCRSNPSNIIVGGSNFGCGSSREHAVYAIKYNNVQAVIAQSFPDIFYRNALNNGLMAIRVSDTSRLSVGDEIEFDLEKMTVADLTKGEHHTVQASESEVFLLKKGGLLGAARARLTQQLRSWKSSEVR